VPWHRWLPPRLTFAYGVDPEGSDRFILEALLDEMGAEEMRELAHLSHESFCTETPSG
jgi:hypothetical protein